jgi:hypothetical protein
MVLQSQQGRRVPWYISVLQEKVLARRRWLPYLVS